MIKEYKISVPYEKAGLNGEGLSPYITAYTLDHNPECNYGKKSAVLICPGGGYDYCSKREAEPVALRFLSYGIDAFVLEYSCKTPFPTNLLEAAAAMAFIRKNADEWNIDRNRIFICGFSAGGHLAASLSVHWNKPFVKDVLGLTDEHKPDGSILGYPVITTGELTHQGSIDNLIADNPTEERTLLVTLDRQVDADTPPAFIWHCADDGCVPVENSLWYAGALSRNKIPFVLHVFKDGGHGLSLADETTAAYDGHINPEAAQWFMMAVDWIKRL